MSFGVNLRIDCSDFAGSGGGFGQALAGIVLVEEKLTLQIAGFNIIAIDNPEDANSCSGEQRTGGSADGATSHYRDFGPAYEFLSLSADGGEEDLAGIAL
jgi:hypothetical protein